MPRVPTQPRGLIATARAQHQVPVTPIEAVALRCDTPRPIQAIHRGPGGMPGQPEFSIVPSAFTLQCCM